MTTSIGDRGSVDFSFIETAPLDLSDSCENMSLSDSSCASSVSRETSQEDILRAPQTDGASLNGRVNIPAPSPDSPENVCRRLFEAVSEPSTAGTPASSSIPLSSQPQEEDIGFKIFVNSFLNVYTPAQAQESAQRRLKSMDYLLEMDPNYTTALATKALCLIIQGKVADFTEVFHLTSRPAIMRAAGIVLQALTGAELALQNDPRHLTALTIKTGCLGLQAQYEHEGLIKPPRFGLTSQKSEVLEDAQAQSALHQKTLDSANELLELEPKNMTGILMKVRALTYQGEREKALETLSSALQIDPDNEVLLALLAKFYYATDLKRALEAISHALKINPRQFLAWDIHLHGLGERGDTEPLLASARQAEEYFPNHPLIFELLEQYLPESFEKPK